MKLSVSLGDEDVEFLDQYAKAQKAGSRSAVIRRALQLLRASELEPAYAGAWTEWEDGPDRASWESAASDGLPGGTAEAG